MSASCEQRALGRTGLHVSVVGLGAGALGELSVSEPEAARLLHGALELGVTLLDTAPSYGASEERLGRHLGPRRQHVVLSTKVGYGVPGVADWTAGCVTAGIELALTRLRTDWLDIVHLHSCPREVLDSPGLIEALEAAVHAGKVRVAAYSGENDALGRAIDCGRFGVVQRSVNLCDQGQLEFPPPPAIGVLAKRPLANAAWSFRDRPAREDVAVYWDRLRALGLDTAGLDWDELALRFAAFVPGVSSCLVGTRRLTALARACELVARGPLLPELLTELRAAWWRAAAGWPGLV